MAADLTEKEFSKHVNTKFQLELDEQTPFELELVEVKGYVAAPTDQAGLERFSAYFVGPAEHYLPQKVYSLQHDKMGELDIFLVPIGQDERGFLYEAVFNYSKE